MIGQAQAIDCEFDFLLLADFMLSILLAELIRSSPGYGTQRRPSGWNNPQTQSTRHSTEPEQYNKGQETICSQLHIL